MVNLNDFMSGDVEKVYNTIMNASKEDLEPILMECLGSYYRLLDKSESSNPDKNDLLMWYKTFYKIARDRAKDIGLDLSLYKENINGGLN